MEIKADLGHKQDHSEGGRSVDEEIELKPEAVTTARCLVEL